MNAHRINYTGSQLYSMLSGNNLLYVVQYPDTARLELKSELFGGTFNLVPGGIYSLFLAGDTDKADTLFVRDIIPPQPDSGAGARFVNLCQDCGPVNVTQQGNTVPDFASLRYKQITAFKSYSANSAVIYGAGYNYAITDGFGNQVATFNWSPTTFMNNTLVICGVDSLQSVQVFQMNNY